MSGLLYLGLVLTVLTSLFIVIFSIYLFLLRNKEIFKEIKSELFVDKQQEYRLKEVVSSNSDKNCQIPTLNVDEPLSIGAFELRTRTGLFTHSQSMVGVIMSGSEIFSKRSKSHHANVLRNINQNALDRGLDTVVTTPHFLFTDTEAFTRPHA